MRAQVIFRRHDGTMTDGTIPTGTQLQGMIWVTDFGGHLHLIDSQSIEFV